MVVTSTAAIYMQNAKPDAILFKQIRGGPGNPRTGLKALVQEHLILTVGKDSCCGGSNMATLQDGRLDRGGGRVDKQRLEKQHKMRHKNYVETGNPHDCKLHRDC